MERNPFTSEIGKRVLLAFARETARWRTIGGIARESGRTTREVAEFIEDNEHCFVESSIRFGGSTLYGIRSEPREQALTRTGAQWSIRSPNGQRRRISARMADCRR